MNARKAMLALPRLFLQALVLAALTAAPATAQHAFYPLQIGDRWTYDSSMRGEFTNVVTDTLRADGQLWYRVESTDAHGTRQVLAVAVGDDGIVRQRLGDAPATVMLDLNARIGQPVEVQAGVMTMTLTLVAEHDTLTILGSRFTSVREYRHATPIGQYWSSYFARGIGQVAIDFPTMNMNVRLLRANVGGRAVKPVADALSSGIDTQLR